jgi:hypothetical protein
VIMEARNVFRILLENLRNGSLKFEYANEVDRNQRGYGHVNLNGVYGQLAGSLFMALNLLVLIAQ